MKDENDFNARLSKELKKLQPRLVALKHCDKYQVGVADFQLVTRGRSVFFECKFLHKIPTAKTKKVLKHVFSGPQLTFLRSMQRARCLCYGLIYLDYCSMIRVVPLDDIPLSGNWDLARWGELDVVAKDFALKDTEALADHLTTDPWEAFLEGPQL